MKVITVYQPWASLLACGAKGFETRTWYTKYRGPIAIHAGLRFLNSFYENFAAKAHDELKARLPGFTYMHSLPRGAIIATAELTGCYLMDHIQEMRGAPWEIGYWKDHLTFCDISNQEILFGDWTAGRYAWKFANATMLLEPIPVKGKQGLWNYEFDQCL